MKKLASALVVGAVTVPAFAALTLATPANADIPPWYARGFQVVKQSEKGTPLSGAVFEVTECLRDFTGTWNCSTTPHTTDDAGAVFDWPTFDWYDNGNVVAGADALFMIKEVKAPDGYSLDPTPRSYVSLPDPTPRESNGPGSSVYYSANWSQIKEFPTQVVDGATVDIHDSDVQILDSPPLVESSPGSSARMIAQGSWVNKPITPATPTPTDPPSTSTPTPTSPTTDPTAAPTLDPTSEPTSPTASEPDPTAPSDDPNASQSAPTSAPTKTSATSATAPSGTGSSSAHGSAPSNSASSPSTHTLSPSQNSNADSSPAQASSPQQAVEGPKIQTDHVREEHSSRTLGALTLTAGAAALAAAGRRARRRV